MDDAMDDGMDDDESKDESKMVTLLSKDGIRFRVDKESANMSELVETVRFVSPLSDSSLLSNTPCLLDSRSRTRMMMEKRR